MLRINALSLLGVEMISLRATKTFAKRRMIQNWLKGSVRERSKISSDQKRFFYRIKPIPPFIFRDHSL